MQGVVMEKFIKITKDGETIEVHPSALADHKRLGWVEVEEDAETESKPEPKPEPVKEKRAKEK
jgi:hypothetical protein